MTKYPLACRSKERVQTVFYFLVILAVIQYSFCCDSQSCAVHSILYTFHMCYTLPTPKKRLKMSMKGHN